MERSHAEQARILAQLESVEARYEELSIRITLPEGAGMERGQDALRALRLHFTELEQNYSEFLSVMEVHTDAED